MTPAVSFVIPTRNSARTIAACVASLRAQTLTAVEIIVVDNHSTDGTPSQASAAGADAVIVGGPERSAQRNLGFRVSRGDVVVFVDSDMVAESLLAERVASTILTTGGVHAAVIPERSFGSGYWARCKVLERALYVGDASVEGARAFHHDCFQASGGYDESLIAFEDWELDDRIRSQGWAVGRVESWLLHDEGSLSLAGCFVKKRYYGRSLWTYLRTGHAQGRIRRPSLLSNFGLLVKDIPHASGMVLLKTAEVAGLVLGAVEARSSNR